MNKAKKLVTKSALLMDGISYLFLVPLAIYIIFYYGGLLDEKLPYAVIGVVTVISISLLHNFIFRYYSIYKPIKNLYSSNSLDTKDYSIIKLMLLKYPLRQAYQSTIIWTYAILILLVFTNIFYSLSINVYLIGLAALSQSVLINFINNYFIAERVVSDVLEEPVLTRVIVENEHYREFSMLKKTIITIVGLSLAIIIVMSFVLSAAIDGQITMNNIGFHYSLILTMLSIILIFTIYMYHSSNKKNIDKMTSTIEKMSRGELNTDLSMISIDELGRLCRDLYKFNDSLKSINSMIYSEINNLYKNSKLLSTEENNSYVSTATIEQILNKQQFDNLYEVTNALHQISTFTKEVFNLIERENYIKNGQARLNAVIQRSNSTTKVSDQLIKNIVNYVHANSGAIYVTNEEQCLNVEGQYAYSGNQSKILVGKGLIGQAALDQEITIINDLPSEEDLYLDMGLVKVKPKSIAIIPCVYNNETSAVIVLGSMNEFDDLHIEWFYSIRQSIALGIRSIQANESNDKLLKQTQELAKELKEQHEELLETNAEMEQVNEELEQQTYELRKSEAAQEEQQKDLMEANKELNAINEKLIHAQEELKKKADNLERAYKYKSEFLANMSHELRTPLNSIIILSRILQTNKNNTLLGKEVEFSETINKAANELLDLINEILDLAKVEAGMMELNIEAVDLKQFISDTKKLFNEIATSKGIDFNIEIDRGVPVSFKTDGTRLKQIIKNLLSNAFKFTHEGSVTLEVYKKAEYLAFSVIDTGIGISSHDQELIFKEFTQADGNINRKYGGTGLGLSISDKLTKLLDGQLEVESKETEGSTFTLSIPEFSEQRKVKQDNKKILLGSNTTFDTTVEDSSKGKDSDAELLVIRDCNDTDKLCNLVEGEISFRCVSSLEEAGDVLTKQEIKLILWDLKIETHDMIHFLKKYKGNTIKVIVYSEQILERDEVMLAKYVDSIIIKQGNSEERLLNECKLYLNKTKDTIKSHESNVFLSSHEILKNKKILIVDDDMRNVFALSSVLESHHVNIVVGKNGKEGLIQLTEHQDIDLILMDIMMPEMDGYETMEEIRKNRNYKQIPIIALTAKAMKDDRQKCLEAGANDYMSKPVDIDQLLSLIKVWIQK